MAKNKEFLGLDGFIWWFGVVESRYDPLQIGRCKVRCMGWHDENRDVLPTDDLPWAIPIQPITSGALSGIGTSATGLLEGSWVFGFFMDGESAQFPVIFGSFAGIPGGEILGDGFRDPRNIYPYANNVPDTPTLARGESEASEDQSLKGKRDARLTEIQKAVASRVDTVLDTSNKDSALFERGTYDEPKPRYGNQEDPIVSTYPYNHVRKTESGHVFEVDDTPSAERIHNYHTAGTFEEIQPDGTKVTKVVGETYEMHLSGKNVYVKGAVNITVEGDTHILTKGNRVEEVDGDYFLTIHGDRITKIGGNDVREVKSDVSEQIDGGINQRAGEDSRYYFGKNVSTSIGKNYSVSVSKNMRQTVLKNSTSIINGNTSFVTFGAFDIGALKNINLAAALKFNVKSLQDSNMTATTLNINNNTNVTGTVDASTDVLGGGSNISLVNHTHPQDDDSGSDTQQDTGAPQ